MCKLTSLLQGRQQEQAAFKDKAAGSSSWQQLPPSLAYGQQSTPVPSKTSKIKLTPSDHWHYAI